MKTIHKLEPIHGEFTKKVFDLLPVMVFAKDIKNDYRFAVWNYAAELITGMEAKSCLGKNDYDFFPKEQADFFRERDLEVTQSGKTLLISKEELKTPYGKKYLRTRKTIIYDEKGSPIYLIGTSEDISRQVEIEDELTHKSKELDKFFNLSLDLLGIADTDGNFIKINPAFEETFGYSAEYLLTRNFQSLVLSEDSEKLMLELKQLKHGQKMLKFEVRSLTNNGKTKHLYWNVSSDPESKVLYISGHDITDLRNQENENQQIIGALYNSAIVTVTDAQGKIIETNKNFCTISGYSEKELLGQTHSIVNSDLHPPDFFEALWKTLTAGKVWIGEIQNRAKNGAKFIVHTAISPLKNSAGKIDRFLAIRFDVTQQRETEGLLEEAQRISKIGSWKLDLTSGKIHWSKQMYEIFDQSKNFPPPSLEELGQKIHPNDHKSWADNTQKALLTGKPYTMRVRSIFPKKTIWVEIRCACLTDVHRQTVGLSGTCHDISDLVDAEDRLSHERALALQAAKLVSLGEMAAGVAHEINNPIAIIDGSCRMLKKYRYNDEKFEEKIKSIEKSTFRISKIVSGLKKFSRSNSDTAKVLIGLRSIVCEAMSMTETTLKRADVSIQLIGDEDGFLICDEIEIEQVFINLINNSIDAVKDLKVRWIKISLENRGDQLIFRISDSGKGIPDAVAKNLFQPFFTTKKAGEGTGLGLPIIKRILDEHKANITLINGAETTCFEIQFVQSSRKKNAA